jgi:hypothetical protein
MKLVVQDLINTFICPCQGIGNRDLYRNNSINSTYILAMITLMNSLPYNKWPREFSLAEGPSFSLSSVTWSLVPPLLLTLA